VTAQRSGEIVSAKRQVAADQSETISFRFDACTNGLKLNTSRAPDGRRIRLGGLID
jgi:hypothetical protein